MQVSRIDEVSVGQRDEASSCWVEGFGFETGRGSVQNDGGVRTKGRRDRTRRGTQREGRKRTSKQQQGEKEVAGSWARRRELGLDDRLYMGIWEGRKTRGRSMSEKVREEKRWCDELRRLLLLLLFRLLGDGRKSSSRCFLIVFARRGSVRKSVREVRWARKKRRRETVTDASLDAS